MPSLGRIVPQISIFEKHIEYIQPETIHAFLQPKVKYIQYSFPHFRVAPVEVRLLFCEHVEEIFACLGIHFPGIAAKRRLPVVWQPAIRFSRLPNIPIPVWIVPAAAGLLEPGVHIRSVIKYQVQNNVNPALMCLRD